MRLAPQKRIILQALAEGRSNEEIADQLDVSVDTVKTHLRYLYRQMGANNRAHAVALGCRWGIVDTGRVLPGFNDQVRKLRERATVE